MVPDEETVPARRLRLGGQLSHDPGIGEHVERRHERSSLGQGTSSFSDANDHDGSKGDGDAGPEVSDRPLEPLTEVSRRSDSGSGSGSDVTARTAVRLLAAHALGATALSLPWPLLLARVYSSTHDDAWVGLTAAGRMLPYVALSALAGMLADRVDRAAVLRWSAGARTVLLGGAAAALGTGHLAAAVVLAVLTVAAGTPAYPAAVAALPRLAPDRTERWTAWLVTVEVSAFVVGPAVGGLLLGAGGGRWTLPLAAATGALSFALLLGLGPAPAERSVGGPRRSRLVTVLRSPGVPAAMAVVALVNLIESAASVALLGLSADRWHAGERGFGAATAALGLGSLAAPLLGRMVALRGSLRLDGTGLLAAGAAQLAVVGVAPLALTGACSTVVECVATQTLQHAVPDRFRAFTLGLTDSAMVAAAALGSLLAPRLVTLAGPAPTFAALGLVLIAVSLWARPRAARVTDAGRKVPAGPAR